MSLLKKQGLGKAEIPDEEVVQIALEKECLDLVTAAQNLDLEVSSRIIGNFGDDLVEQVENTYLKIASSVSSDRINIPILGVKLQGNAAGLCLHLLFLAVSLHFLSRVLMIHSHRSRLLPLNESWILLDQLDRGKVDDWLARVWYAFVLSVPVAMWLAVDAGEFVDRTMSRNWVTPYFIWQLNYAILILLSLIHI